MLEYRTIMSRAPADINCAHTPDFYKYTHNVIWLALSEAHCAEHDDRCSGE